MRILVTRYEREMQEIGNNITEKCLKCFNTTEGNNHCAVKKRWREMRRNESQWKGDKRADGQRVNINSRKKGKSKISRWKVKEARKKLSKMALIREDER